MKNKPTTPGKQLLSMPFLVILLIIVFSLWLILQSVLDGASEEFDQNALKLINENRSALLTEFFMWMTIIGNRLGVLFLLVLFGLISFNWTKSLVPGLYVIAVVVFSAGFTHLVKMLVNRPRPDLGLVEVFSQSFPSGHAQVSMTMLGLFLYFIWKFVTKQNIKVFFSVLLPILIILVSFSRAYLGVHYPSDIAAGSLIGLLFLVLGIVFWERLSEKVIRGKPF